MEIPISIVILTQNEEQNLPDCLQSINWCGDIHIIDSGSTDNTINLIQMRGLQHRHHPFETFGKQRNWAIENCRFKYKWVLFLDADERSTTEFKDSISEALAKADDSVAGFYCCSKTILGGHWLKRSALFPNWQFRILCLGKAEFMDFGHGQKESGVKGHLEYVKAPYLHCILSKGWTEWRERHRRYSEQEAAIRLNSKIDWKGMLSKDSSIRNMALRPFVSRIPGWPLLRFCIDYFFRLGLLEGLYGFIYCANMAYYELLIQKNIIKLLRKRF